MKLSKSQIHTSVQNFPELRFEDQRLTSFSGSILLQALFQKLHLKNRLKDCFEHRTERLIVGFHGVALIIILHLMLGYRRLRDCARYKDDPAILRTLNLRRLPDVSTITRTLSRLDRGSIENVRRFSSQLVVDRLAKENISRVTLDFDGSVISTARFAEGTAVGYNKVKKGARSYYPLFCMVSQTAQVLDVLHRKGNVHDSHDSISFIAGCVSLIKESLPGLIVETRHDSAFFSDKMVSFYTQKNIQFSISVPFERFPVLKKTIESRKHWKRLDCEWDYFELGWVPNSWKSSPRFLCMRHRVKKQNKDPVQLELFAPYEEGYDFKVIVTNKTGKAKNILLFHNGRGSQENTFSELKSQCNMDYVPTRQLCGNQLYFLSAIIAHNLYRELQMTGRRFDRSVLAKRPALWIFEDASTIRQSLIQRAGRLTRPHGKLRLTMSGNETTRKDIMHYLDRLKEAV